MNISLEAAQLADVKDPLAGMRKQFLIPPHGTGEQIYFLGNSLGLQPVRTRAYLDQILNDWATYGVEAFFHAPDAWMNYHDHFLPTLSTVTGAQPHELVVMNQLTVNLQLLLVSFYRPVGKRVKIICEAKAFPSDQYSLETHLRHHGFDPEKTIVEVSPREGEHLLHTEDIIAAIEKNAEETALVLFGGINYYTGQVLDMPAITAAAHKAGALVGFDLAHAAGNIPLQLHDWDVDFACWCTYKYLNSGPGAIGGVFIHERHHQADVPRLAGWWGYDKPTRFLMQKGFVPMPGAQGWQLSTPSLLLYAAHRAALDVVAEAGWDVIQAKRQKLTAFLWAILDDVNQTVAGSPITILTPRDPAQQGSQVSLLMQRDGKNVFDALAAAGIITDWREPDVIRLAPVPLYNTFEEVWRFGHELKKVLLG